MVCSVCGTPAATGVNFCAKCGTPLAHDPQPETYPQAPPPPIAAHYGVPYTPQLRVRRNLQTMAILWYLFAAYRAIAGFFGVAILSAFSSHTHGWWGSSFPHDFGDDAPHWIAGAMVPVLAVATLALVGLSVSVGWGLMNRRPWARTVAIVAAVLALLKFPIGTALGIYTLWVLAPTESGLEWDTIADRT
jgi:hypothetical protein